MPWQESSPTRSREPSCDTLDQVGGLHGWQWVFLLESIPSVILGVCILLLLTDRPEQAHWLGPRPTLVARRRECGQEETWERAPRDRLPSAPCWTADLVPDPACISRSRSAPMPEACTLPELIRHRFPRLDSSRSVFSRRVPSCAAGCDAGQRGLGGPDRKISLARGDSRPGGVRGWVLVAAIRFRRRGAFWVYAWR